VAARSDLLLGPYFTVLRRAADDMAAEAGWLVWNHGGSGDDVETAHPGHVVSVLTPTSRYMQPFLSHLAASADPTAELRIVNGKGRFGRQVAGGAVASAWRSWVSATSAQVRPLRCSLMNCPRIGF
jgi:branched-chain amino acid transport system substrate-binding protein